MKKPSTETIATATGRHDPTLELKGIIDSASRQRLGNTGWLDHPTIEAARRRVAVARERFGQSRQLEELLLRYRRYLAPNREAAPIVAPSTEAIRGRINDAELAFAWARLRETILNRHADILRESSAHRRLTEELRVTTDHLQILDDLIAVTDAKIRTGGARQADLLSLRGERARLAASLAGIAARKASSRARIADYTRSKSLDLAAILARNDLISDHEGLRSRIRASNLGLLAERAELDRRHETLRLADLNASRSPGRPDGGVRAATRSEARERVAEQRQRVKEVESRLDRDLATTLAEVEAASQDLDALTSRTIPDARSALSDTRAAFAGRAGSFLDLFRSARRLLEAELAVAQSRDRLLRAQVNLHILLGSTHS